MDVCAFCKLGDVDELNLGKLYQISKGVKHYSCHYFCVLLSSKCVPSGNDDEGIFGFLLKDIEPEIRRGSKTKCVYCKKYGANLGCQKKACLRTYHLPCSVSHGGICVFENQYPSFCARHAPTQTVAPEDLKYTSSCMSFGGVHNSCSICYDPVIQSVCRESIYPPCCKNGWLHRKCIQSLALSVGSYLLKCPLCNDNEIFVKEITRIGIFIPIRDASWERVSGAFNDLYYRYDRCDAEICLCPNGRHHTGMGLNPWSIELCELCGSSGIHIACKKKSSDEMRYKCNTCLTNNSQRKVPERLSQTLSQASLQKKRLREENTSYLEIHHGRTKIARRSSAQDVGDNSEDDSDEEKDCSIVVNKLINQGASTSRGFDNVINSRSTPTEIHDIDGSFQFSPKVCSTQRSQSDKKQVESQKVSTEDNLVSNGQHLEQPVNLTNSKVKNFIKPKMFNSIKGKRLLKLQSNNLKTAPEPMALENDIIELSDTETHINNSAGDAPVQNNVKVHTPKSAVHKKLSYLNSPVSIRNTKNVSRLILPKPTSPPKVIPEKIRSPQNVEAPKIKPQTTTCKSTNNKQIDNRIERNNLLEKFNKYSFETRVEDPTAKNLLSLKSNHWITARRYASTSKAIVHTDIRAQKTIYKEPTWKIKLNQKRAAVIAENSVNDDVNTGVLTIIHEEDSNENEELNVTVIPASGKELPRKETTLENQLLNVPKPPEEVIKENGQKNDIKCDFLKIIDNFRKGKVCLDKTDPAKGEEIVKDITECLNIREEMEQLKVVYMEKREKLKQLELELREKLTRLRDKSQ